MTLHMKSKNLILSAILIAVSSTVMAQENIQKAFDALRQSRLSMPSSKVGGKRRLIRIISWKETQTRG